MRSTPLRVKTVSWITTSRSVPSNIRPPTLEYSPSVFSRTTQKSMSPGSRPASGLDAGHQPDRAQVDVLVELAPERQQAPTATCGRARRGADGAEEDRVEAAQRVEPVLGQHRAVRW